MLGHNFDGYSWVFTAVDFLVVGPANKMQGISHFLTVDFQVCVCLLLPVEWVIIFYLFPRIRGVGLEL